MTTISIKQMEHATNALIASLLLLLHWSQLVFAGSVKPFDLRLLQNQHTPSRPQTPVKPFSYEVEEITFPSLAPGVTMAGTFTKPFGSGPFASVILISGSGPQDRDESVMGHKPFLVLADHLTRRGIAVLRYDDRGTAQSTGDFASATTKDFADDTAGAVAYLKARKDVGKIGLIGHSEGGVIAPMVASQSSDVAFIVLLAGCGIPGEAIILNQSELNVRAMGGSETTIASQKAIQQKLFAIAKEENVEKRNTALADLEKGMSDSMKAALRSQIGRITGPWYRYYLSYDPSTALKKVKCPVLALNGEKDLQVSAKENLAAIEQALKAGGNMEVTTKELPGLNHLFQPAKTGLIQEYGKIETTFDSATLSMISDWVTRQSKLGGSN